MLPSGSNQVWKLLKMFLCLRVLQGCSRYSCNSQLVTHMVVNMYMLCQIIHMYIDTPQSVTELMIHALRWNISSITMPMHVWHVACHLQYCWDVLGTSLQLLTSKLISCAIRMLCWIIDTSQLATKLIMHYVGNSMNQTSEVQVWSYSQSSSTKDFAPFMRGHIVPRMNFATNLNSKWLLQIGTLNIEGNKSPAG